jgi:type IV secretory pathway TraG/TraD family ATPase VirD4
MPSALRVAWESLRLSAKAGEGLLQLAGNQLEQAQERRGARAARRGTIGPDDPPPPPELTGGIFDYSGLARPRELPGRVWSYRLGRLRRAERQWGLLPGEFGLGEGDILRHAAVIGPSGSGKRSSILIPWIYGALRSGRSVVATDTQGELWNALSRYGATQGTLNVEVFHWNHRDPRVSSSWRWIDEIDSDNAIEVAVQALLGCRQSSDPRRLRDARLLTALLTLSGGSRPRSAAELLEALSERTRLAAFLSRFPRSDPVRELSELLALSPDQYSNAVNGPINGLRPLGTPELRRITETRGFNLSMLSSRPTLLIVGCPMAGSRTAEIPLALMVALASQRWMSGSVGAHHPGMLVLDEAPLIQDRVRLSMLLSLGANANLAIVLAAQGVGQFDEHQREEILSNCATMVMLPGVGRSSTQYLAQRLGQRPAVGLASSVQRGAPWKAPQRGRSTSSHMVDMIGHREISTPPFEGYPAVVHAGTIHPRPILVDLTREDL